MFTRHATPVRRAAPGGVEKTNQREMGMDRERPFVSDLGDLDFNMFIFTF